MSELTTYWVVDMRRSCNDEPEFGVRESFDEAINVAHRFFTNYGWTVEQHGPFDPDNSNRLVPNTDDPKDGGYTVFDEYRMDNGRVYNFMHCGGDGPCCYIRKARR